MEREIDENGNVVLSVDYINAFRTYKGSFTRPQVEALGLSWTGLRKGWIARLEGKTITPEQADKFEARIYSSKKERRLPKKSISKNELIKKVNILMDDRLIRARDSFMSEESFQDIIKIDKEIMQLIKITRMK